jgi:hypothetical protein
MQNAVDSKNEVNKNSKPEVFSRAGDQAAGSAETHESQPEPGKAVRLSEI